MQPYHRETLVEIMAAIPFLLVSRQQVEVVVVRRMTAQILKPETLVGQVVALLQ